MSASLVRQSDYELRNGFPKQPVRCFHLKAMGRSPAHGHLSLSGEEDDGEESASISLGTTVHALIQGKTDLVVYPGAVRRGKEWEAFKAKNKGVRIVLQKERDMAMAMGEALLGNKDAARLLTASRVRREETIFFNHLGRDCRATPDIAARSWSWFADLKTTRCADPDRFRFDARKLHYHVQIAMQRLALRSLGGKPKEAFIIAVESAAPWPVTVMEVDEDSMLAGEKQMHLWLERLIGCEAAGEWPGYVQTVVPLNIVERHEELEWDEDDAGAEANP